MSAARTPRHASMASNLAAIDGLEARAGESLAGHTTFRIGGPAEWYVELSTTAALRRLLVLIAASRTPIQILGLGSNILFPDDGLPGVVVRLAGDFRRLVIDGTTVTAGAALSLSGVARKTARAGLVGLEALSGFPSTVGGAVVMNAGCYGAEIHEVLATATLVEPDGAERQVTAAELEPGYRTSNLQGTATIVAEAVFELTTGDATAAVACIDALNRKRWRALPSGVASAGSIFKNPPGDYAGRLLEACGLKGSAHGGARISSRHANVIVNEQGASASDVLALMLEMRAAVGDRFAVELVPELVLAGRLADLWRAESCR